jgi:hypothetical protein
MYRKLQNGQCKNMVAVTQYQSGAQTAAAQTFWNYVNR